jgi:hypothetical protein
MVGFLMLVVKLLLGFMGFKFCFNGVPKFTMKQFITIKKKKKKTHTHNFSLYILLFSLCQQQLTYLYLSQSVWLYYFIYFNISIYNKQELPPVYSFVQGPLFEKTQNEFINNKLIIIYQTWAGII